MKNTIELSKRMSKALLTGLDTAVAFAELKKTEGADETLVNESINDWLWAREIVRRIVVVHNQIAQADDMEDEVI